MNSTEQLSQPKSYRPAAYNMERNYLVGSLLLPTQLQSRIVHTGTFSIKSTVELDINCQFAGGKSIFDEVKVTRRKY